MARIFRPSEAARELGISVEWLRAAEKLGRVPPAHRDINGWRFYLPEDLEDIRQQLFPLKQKGQEDDHAEAQG